MAHEQMVGKHPVEAYVISSKCDRVDERSEGVTIKKNMIMGVRDHEEIKTNVKVPMEKAMSMPDMENKMKNSERFKK